jgi:zinc transporter, ZIP family
VSQVQTLLLGAIAGGTIFIGLPIGRLRSAKVGLRHFVTSIAIGVLLFLIWDVLTHGYAPVNQALSNFHNGSAGIGPVFGYGSLFLGGIAVGLMSLSYYERWLGLRVRRRAGGPGAMAASELSGIAGWSPAKRLSLLIAIGIGLHNLGEGLAIGASAAAGAIGLATVLVIGFSLHNATEGFGIVGPLANESERPSWPFLMSMGLIGGGPTFVGTVIGRQFTNAGVSVAFLSLAAGSILYVVIQLLGVVHKNPRRDLLYWGVALGLAAGFITDMVVSAGGA